MKSKLSSYLLLILTFFIWGSLYVVSKYVLDKLPVLTTSFLRFVIADLALLSVVKFRHLPGIQRCDYKYLFFIGFVGYFISINAQLIGTKFCQASLASLINSTNPMVITVLAAFLLKESLTVKKIAGILLSFAGVYIILGLGGSAAFSPVGILFSFVSVFLWSCTSIVMRRINQKYDPLVITAYGILIAVVFSAPLSVYEVIHTSRITLDLPALLSLLYMGLVCTGIAHFLWNKSLSVIEASTCSMLYPLQPLSSLLLGVLFLGEHLTLTFAAGGILILAGVVLSLLPNKVKTIS